jgi:cyanate lyase
MASEKTVTYTPEMTAELVEAYKASPTEATVATLAEKFGKSVRSIVAKLAREEVYVAKATTKAAAKATTKADLRKLVEKRLDIEADALESLEKGSKAALEALVAALADGE